MPNSFAQAAQMTCPECSQSFDVKIWLIIDAAERKDLLEQIKQGKLDDAICPHCGMVGQMGGAPLLLYRPDQRFPLIFAPVQQVSSQQSNQHAIQLLSRLAQSLGDTWQKEWLEQIVEVPRAVLELALEGDALLAFLSSSVKQQRRKDDGISIPPEFQQELRQAQENEQHYLQTGLMEALDAAVQSWENILGHPSFSGASLRFQLAVLNSSGSIFLRRYWRSGLLVDLNHALSLLKQAVALTPPASPDLPGYLNNLGNGLITRYHRVGALPDLEEAIRTWQQVVALTLPDSPSLPGCFTNLGNGLRDLYNCTGMLPNLEEAIRVCQKAVALTPSDSTDLPARLANLGLGLRDHYNRTGTLEDLEEAIRVSQQAVALTPPDSPNRSTFLNNLGNVLSDRYISTGALPDLEEVIRVFQQAVALNPQDSPDRPSLLSNLSAGLRARYSRTGTLSDLEEAIRVSQQAVVLTSLDSPDLPDYLNNLGAGLSDRYRRIGTFEDLNEAIRVSQQGVALTQPDSPNRPSLLSNLGAGLRDRYGRTGALSDLEEAIRVSQQALMLIPQASPNKPTFLTNLGAGLNARYQRTGTLEDLEEIIRVSRQALELTSPDSPNRPGYLNNLGIVLRDRYSRTGSFSDLEETIRFSQEAVALTPPESPDRPIYLNNLGNGLRNRYSRMGALADLEEAIASYRQACELGSLVSQEMTLTSSRNWGNLVLERQAWEEACQAYAFGLQASQRLFQTQLSRSAKESWLEEARGLASNAAFAFAKMNDLPNALVTLEGGRARMLGESLERNRIDLEHLADHQVGHKDLLERYRVVSQRIETLTRLASGESLPGMASARPMDWKQQVETAQTEILVIIEQIRQVPGYETFLLSFTAEQIQVQAKDSPLVYLATTSAGGLALIVTSHDIQVIWLDSLTEKALREQVQGPDDAHELGGYLGAYRAWQEDPYLPDNHQVWKQMLDISTRWLWDALMEPVTQSLEKQSFTQAVLIPGGLLGLLPLHAAWIEDSAAPGCRRYALDKICFTYAPSARSLQEGQEIAARTLPDSLLAIDNPDGSLKASGEEVRAALAMFDHTLHLPGEKASRQTVIKSLPNYLVLHFSTHGRAGWAKPLQGGLLLADGFLTLDDLLSLRLPGVRLAVLSACETGVPGMKLPDEVVSLPSGLIQAGVAGVAASLWSVAQISTAMLMSRFYEMWRQNGLQPAEALRQAQFWLRDSTDGEKKAYFQSALSEFTTRKMPSESADVFFKAVVFNDPAERSFAHPYYWAAFTYSGV